MLVPRDARRIYDTPNGRFEVTCTGDESEGALHEMRATYPPRAPYPPPHCHPSQDERFVVVEGTMTFLVDGTEHVVPTGGELEVPRGVVHQVRNGGDVPAVVMWQTRPALRTAEFHDAVNTATSEQDWPGLEAALREYRDVFRLVPDPYA